MYFIVKGITGSRVFTTHNEISRISEAVITSKTFSCLNFGHFLMTAVYSRGFSDFAR